MRPFRQIKTFFQTNSDYDPRLDISVDGIVVHPHNTRPHEPAKMQDSWAGRGVPVGRMFFADSDDLNEYWEKSESGACLSADVELKQDGSPMLCSGIRPYMVPTDKWIAYLRDRKVKPSLENGIQAVLPEEPLGHTFTGYEESIKTLYKEKYGCDWKDPANSPETHYRIARLKADLYRRLEDDLCAVTKAHSPNTDFVVPVHSLFSNKANQLTAPLGLLLQNRNFDGYIGQVWTGPVQWCMKAYQSDEVSFFSTAFTLYDYFVQLVNGTGKKLWLLVDPVEDDPHHSWEDFRSWYQQCTAAMLMMSEVDSYEVMPWPERIFLPISFTPGIDDPTDNPTPADYFTLVLSITQALQEMPLGGEWLDGAEDVGLGIAVADSAMWKPNETFALQGLFGLRIPLLERGVIARNFVMERAGDATYADRFSVIVLSCEDWDYYDADMPGRLAEWVRRGGTLIVFGENEVVRELGDDLGAGRILASDVSPKEFADAAAFESVYQPLLEEAGINMTRRSGFAMQRGDYVIAHALSEPMSLAGHFIDVFSPDLCANNGLELAVGSCGVFKQYNPQETPAVIHSTCRLMEQSFDGEALRFTICGPQETRFAARISLGGYACEGKTDVICGNNGTLKVTGKNSPDGVTVKLKLTFKEEVCCV